MSTNIKLSTKFIISGIKADNSRVYYAIDTHSGGYPYWSTYHGSAKEFDAVVDVYQVGKEDYMRKEVIKIEVLKVESIASIVRTEEIVSAAKAKAMAEIDEIQKKLNEKTAALRRMS